MEKKIKRFFQEQHKGIFTVFLFLWLKTYIVSRFVFDLPINNVVEEVILLLNSFVSSIFLLTLITFTSKRVKVFRRFIILSFIATLILYANVVYYRFFNDFITVPVLFQFKNFSDLGGSAVGLMKLWDPILFVEYILLALYVRKQNINTISYKGHSKKILLSVCVVTFLVNLGLAESQRPQLLTRIFDREMVVKYLGVYNYHAFDAYIHSKSKAQRTFAEGSDVVEVENFLNTNKRTENEFTGIVEGKNVILVSMESIQNFLIDYKVEGQEVMPFLNDLIHESFYFNNFHHQTGQGKTSDSEFTINNSLYSLPRGAVFTTNSQNEYYAIPEIIKEHGYTSAVFHGNNKSFWNRDIMYETLGYDKFFHELYYQVTEENSINYGLKDIPFFEQSMPLLESLPEPFYAKFITLTHHYPYLLDEADQMIPPFNSNSGTVNRYFQTARYFDESLKVFFEDLKESGIYDDSIIILYGDHYGISDNHNKAMSQVLGKEIRPYEQVELQEVPLLIHIPGMEGKTISTISGQIDLKPTILNMLGIQVNKDIQFGYDLFDKERRELVIHRDGSFVTPRHLYTSDICYSRLNLLEVDQSECESMRLKVEQELQLSDKVIQLDLLRFIDF